ncbi:hypothetical protein [Variovorax boronicumulans]|uniref:hypothetical protein n=1 Tax=Variovorax boronicumulans TaxID=436515 RepID=UPI0012FDDFE1|nr:hypothetical protein [Variovorax boronicumulans]
MAGSCCCCGGITIVGIVAGNGPAGTAGDTVGKPAGGVGSPMLSGARTGSCSVNAAGPSRWAPSVAARTPTDCST